MVIAQASRDEAPEIIAVAEQSWAATYRDIISPGQYRYMMELFYSLSALQKTMEEQTFLLLKEGEEVRGFVAYQLNYPHAGFCKIHKLYLLPETQGTGAGRKLVEEVEGIACRHQCSCLTLNVNKYNKALGFYQKMGFEVERSEVIDIGQGYIMDDFVLIKNLTPSSMRTG